MKIQDRELLLSLNILANLAGYDVARRHMRSAGVMSSLSKIAKLNFAFGALDCSHSLLQVLFPLALSLPCSFATHTHKHTHTHTHTHKHTHTWIRCRSGT